MLSLCSHTLTRIPLSPRTPLGMMGGHCFPIPNVFMRYPLCVRLCSRAWGQQRMKGRGSVLEQSPQVEWG